MNKLFKFFWLISLLLYFGTLLLIYAFLPEQVGINANTHGLPDEFISKENFFYVSLAVFALSNALFYALYKLLYATSRSAATVSAMRLRQAIGSWLLGFAAVLNLFFMLAMSFFSMLNSKQKYDIDLLIMLVYTGPILMAIMFGILIYILMGRRDKVPA